MQMKYCAYSYLDESSSLCDYEVATDKLASLTAAMCPLCQSN